jgi:hypothetical protein
MIFRFDACRLVARAELPPGGDVESVAALLARAKVSTGAPAAPVNTKKVAGVVLFIGGLALAGTGAYFALRASDAADSVRSGCTVVSPCANASLASWGNDYDSARLWSTVLLSTGAAAVATGAILYLVGRSGAPRPSSSAVSLVPLGAHGAAATWSLVF